MQKTKTISLSYSIVIVRVSDTAAKKEVAGILK